MASALPSLRQLRYLVELADRLNFRQAAEACEEAELGTAALGPDAAGKSVHLDGGRLRLGQDLLRGDGLRTESRHGGALGAP